MEKITTKSRKPAKRQGPSAPVLAASSTDAAYGQRSPAKAKPPKPRQQTRPKRRGSGRSRHHYWLTPKAWAKTCSHCHERPAVALRPNDHKGACEVCVDRLGIHAHESQGWRDGGSKAGADVTVRYVDPATLREQAA